MVITMTTAVQAAADVDHGNSGRKPDQQPGSTPGASQCVNSGVCAYADFNFYHKYSDSSSM